MKEASIGIIFNSSASEVLLIKRRDVPIWVLPGGGIETGETADMACAREVIEETGLEVQVVRKIGLWLPINRLASPSHLFECEPKHEIGLLLAQAESQEVRFWPVAKLPETLFFLHKSWIEEALKKNPLPVVKNMEELTYWRAASLLCQHPIYSLRYLLSRLGCPINK
jgi:8-oxo-dGTP pyrophosphatase MutT (NUDIX family)